MYDVVIVGGGHNGLVCGFYLARAGLTVVCLERRNIVGGACVTESPWPGYKVSTAAFHLALMPPKIIFDLDLKKHGVEINEVTPAVSLMEDGSSFVFWSDPDKFKKEIARYSEKDAEAFVEYTKYLKELVEPIRDILWETPPNVGSKHFKELVRTGQFAWKYKRYRHLFDDIYELFTMSAHDFLSRWFESDEVIALMSYFVASGGTHASPKARTTAFTCIRNHVRDNSSKAGPAGFVTGGMGSVTQAIAASGRSHGLEIRTDAAVAQVLVESGRAAGVRLESGETIRSKCVVSAASAQTTYQKLIPSEHVPARVAAAIRGMRTRSSIFKIHYALTSLPNYTALKTRDVGFPHPSTVRIGTTVDYLERAFSDAVQEKLSRDLILAIMAPTAHDSTLAPPDKHLLLVSGAHVNYQDDASNLVALRDLLLERVTSKINAFAPGFRDSILHTDVLLPNDLEERFNLPRGHVHHGDMTIDQSFTNRPIAGYADYRTTLDGMYLAGSSAHPGGGVTGMPGHNAAREILKDLR